MKKCIYEKEMMEKGYTQSYGLEHNCRLCSNNLDLCEKCLENAKGKEQEFIEHYKKIAGNEYVKVTKDTNRMNHIIDEMDLKCVCGYHFKGVEYESNGKIYIEYIIGDSPFKYFDFEQSGYMPLKVFICPKCKTLRVKNDI